MIRGIARRLWWKRVWLKKEGKKSQPCLCQMLPEESMLCCSQCEDRPSFNLGFFFFFLQVFASFTYITAQNFRIKKKTCYLLMFSTFGWRICVVKQVCGGALCEWAQADNLLKAQGLSFPCTLCSAYTVIRIPAMCLWGRTEGFFTSYSVEAHRSRDLRCYFLPNNIVILSAMRVLGLMA